MALMYRQVQQTLAFVKIPRVDYKHSPHWFPAGNALFNQPSTDALSVAEAALQATSGASQVSVLSIMSETKL